MAKRRKKTGTHRRPSRRRSIGGTATGQLMDVAGLIGGALIAKQLPKLLTSLDPKIMSAGVVVAGVMLPKFVKSPLMKSVGDGMITVGGLQLVGSFVPALAGVDDVVLLSGLDEIGDISEVNGINEVNGIDQIGEFMMEN
jgi:hypothetical protein